MASALGGAQTVCPWLNNATAAGTLNGPVSLKVQGNTGNGGSCLFQYHEGSTIYALQIVVRNIKVIPEEIMTDESHCRSQPMPLKGIGNEAISCRINSNYLYGEQVVGRVREKEFIIGVGSNLGKNQAMSIEMLEVKARSIAEQIAGSLF